MSEHRMIPGSHERLRGPECFCGREWDWFNDTCTITYEKQEEA